MKVKRIEVGKPSKPVMIEDVDLSPLWLDESGRAQLLNDSIRMHGARSDRILEKRLRRRKMKR